MMKKFLFAFACISGIINLAAEINSETWQKIEMLEKIEKYDLSREIIVSQFRSNLCKSDVIKLIKMNEKLVATLEPYPIKNTVLEKINNTTAEEWKDQKYQLNFEVWCYLYDKDVNYSELFKERYKAILKTIKLVNMADVDFSENPHPNLTWGFVEKEDILKQLKKFDVLKNNIEQVQSIIRQKIINSSAEQITGLNSFLENFDKQKELIKKHRTEYLSYIAVFPYVMAAQRIAQNLVITKKNYRFMGRWAWGDVDSEILDELGRLLALACYREWLFQCDKNIRDIFFSTLSQTKANVPTEQFQDFKARYSLLDSNDPSKARGADAWWK